MNKCFFINIETIEFFKSRQPFEKNTDFTAKSLENVVDKESNICRSLFLNEQEGIGRFSNLL